MWKLAFLALSGLLILVASETPIEVDRNDDIVLLEERTDTQSYRVPEDFDPIHFEVEVTPYFDTAPEGKSTFSFDGIVTIYMKVNRLLVSCNLFITIFVTI